MAKKLTASLERNGLDTIAEACGQKKRVAALCEDTRAALTAAIRLVALRKAQAYARARTGELAAGGWIERDRQLAAALTTLHAHLLSADEISMDADEMQAARAHRAADAERSADVSSVAASSANNQLDFGFN